mgnify:CR=1 FL=1
MEREKPVFEKRIFWDVNFEQLDYDKRAAFVIERVFERGDVQDIRNCRRYYGDEKIRDVLVGAKWLSPHTIYLAAALFNNTPNDYSCFRQAQLNRGHWHY